MIDEKVMQIVDDAAAGVALGLDELVYLLRFDPYSVEAAYALARAREVGMRACDGRGYLFAQIGVDAGPCPGNCRFCAFAACNVVGSGADGAESSAWSDGGTVGIRNDEAGEGRAGGGVSGVGGGAENVTISDKDRETKTGSAKAGGGNLKVSSVRGVSVGRIVHLARLFDREGADLISLMATAGLGVERYLDIVRAVRSSVSSDVSLMANVGDLTIEQANALREAGVSVAYHAVRLGEGEITDIDPMVRKRTMRHLAAAGVRLMTGVEPLWEGADPDQIAQIIVDIPKFDPLCIGACAYTPTGVSSMGDCRQASAGMVRYVAALLRLTCGRAVPLGGIGGVAWVDAGSDPRERGYASSDEALAFEMAHARKRLASDGFAL